jgi:hypothetical protein
MHRFYRKYDLMMNSIYVLVYIRCMQVEGNPSFPFLLDGIWKARYGCRLG